MHEMSLAQNLISQLQSLAKQHETHKVIRIQVEVGPFSGVVVDSFEFGFNTLAAEHALTQKSRLEIIRPLPSFVCSNCGHLYDKTPEKPSICIKCQSDSFFPKGGNGLTLLRVEME